MSADSSMPESGAASQGVPGPVPAVPSPRKVGPTGIAGDEDYDLDELASDLERSLSPRRRIEEYHEARRLRHDLEDDQPTTRRRRSRRER